MKSRLILKSFQSPGDVVMLSAAVRDLHAAHPGRFQTDVRTSADAIWENNPLVTELHERDPEVASLDMHYPLVHQSNQRPYHFLHGYTQYLEQQLDLRIPVTKFRGDIYLSAAEKHSPPLDAGIKLPERFWIIVAGGKYDFTAKWWNPASYQAVVDHFNGRIYFVQCGEQGHWHPRLQGTVDLIGKTSLREFIRLMYYAEGVLCPVTLAMHLAAAVESKPGRPRIRPCVVVGGGREPAHWEAYPNHQYISTNGMLACCAQGGCWKSRCQLVGDGDPKDKRDVCESPVQVATDLQIPKCLDMIAPQDVIQRMEWYFNGGNLSIGNGHRSMQRTDTALAIPKQIPNRQEIKEGTVTKPDRRRVLLTFRHGLGDAVQLTVVLRHLAQCRPDWEVDVAALTGKHSAFHGLCRNTSVLEGSKNSRYDHVYELEWHEARQAYTEYPSTKPTGCLLEVFGIEPQLDLCHYSKPKSTTASACKAS